MSELRIFSYLPNPRIWKATIAARIYDETPAAPLAGAGRGLLLLRGHAGRPEKAGISPRPSRNLACLAIPRSRYECAIMHVRQRPSEQVRSSFAVATGGPAGDKSADTVAKRWLKPRRSKHLSVTIP